jgi:hypothetical protein
VNTQLEAIGKFSVEEDKVADLGEDKIADLQTNLTEDIVQAERTKKTAPTTCFDITRNICLY